MKNRPHVPSRPLFGPALLGLLAVSVGAGGAYGAPAAQEPADAPPTEAQASADTPAARLALLRELSELDLPARVVAEGRAAVDAEGPLAASGEAAALVALALFATGDEAGADALLAAALERGVADRVHVDLTRARLAIARDDLDGAVALLLRDTTKPSTAFHPDTPETYLLLGRAMLRKNRHELASGPLKKFLQMAPLHPEGPRAWHMLFECALREGDEDLAATALARRDEMARWHDLMKARRLQALRAPDAPLPRLGIALLWIEVGELERARLALAELLARHPEHAEGWLHLGEVHRAAGRPGEAEGAYDRALAADPDEHRARFNRAMLYLQDGRSDRAREELEILAASPVGVDPVFAPLHLHLARLLRDAGEAGAAEQRYAVYRSLGGTEAL